MRGEHRARQSTKAGDQHHSVSEQVSPAHRRFAVRATPFDVNRHGRALLSDTYGCHKLSRIGPGKLFEVPWDVTFQSVCVERQRKCNRVRFCLGQVGRGRDAIKRETLLFVTVRITRRRHETNHTAKPTTAVRRASVGYAWFASLERSCREFVTKLASKFSRQAVGKESVGPMVENGG